ncbi:MAG: TonB-dependent receptor [Verrucomicrobia bacterium]|nr:TonB-dependent receptor [Verrucomicrobiota bacterium]
MNNPLLAAVSAAARLGFVALLGAGILAAQTAPKPTEKKDDSNEPQKLEKFEVTGSRIKQVDVEGPSPIKIIDRVEIEASGRTNLTDLLRDMPEAGFTGINEGGTTAAVRGSTALNLRDLGANNTLVIVNGRRTVATANASGGTVFVDLNRFPIAMVERVEVLKDGASAIYGADATAGVVNIILRKDYNGVEVSTSYGNSTKTDVGEKSFSLFAGAASGKASATIGVTFFERGALKAVDTNFGKNADLSARYAAKGAKYADLVAGGFFDLRSGTGPQARINLTGLAAGQVNGQNGVNIPGLAAGATITRLPGTGGTPAGSLTTATPSFTNPSQVGTGGQFNAAATATYVPQILTPQSSPSNLYNFQEFVWLTPEVQRTGLNFTYRYDISKNLTLFSEGAYQQNKSHIELAPSPISTAGDNNILVPKTNYWNPFGVDLNFAFRPVDIGPRKADISNNSYSLLFGARGTLFDKWDWEVGYTYGYDEVVDLTTNAISESRLRAALARSTPDALNIFGGANFKNSPATLNGIRVQSQKAGNAGLDAWDGLIRGDLFNIPTGTVGSAFHAGWRKEKFNVANDALSTTLDDIIGQVRLADATQSRRTVKFAAAELGVPLVKPGRYTGFYDLDLRTAARFEDFSDGYNSGVKPYFGLRYQPVKDLLLRGSLQRTFRAPTLVQLYGGESQSLPNGLPDLRRPQALTGDPFDGASTQRLVRQGGNPNLTPETAKSYQYGFVYDVPVKALKGLSVGVSYIRIEQTNIITTTGTAYIRSNEVGGGTADLIVRDPGTESYRNNTAANINVLSGPNGAVTPVAPGQTVTVPGRIQAILDRVQNLAYQRVEAIDYELNYRKRTAEYGQFSWRSNVSYLVFYGSTRTPATTGAANVVGRDGYPRYRIQNSLLWTRKEWLAGATHNFINHYGNFTTQGYEVGRYYTIGGFIAYDIPASSVDWLNNTRLTLGVDNLFNKEPPLYYNAVGYDQSFVARPVGRFFSIGLRKTY